MKLNYYTKNEIIYSNNILIQDPIISIILPTYCRGDNGLLKRAINSVFNQTFKAWELIIVDDGSKDSTQELVKKYLSKDNRIIYIRNEVNSSLPALRVVQGLLHARGKYISYQFDDDYWYNNMLQDLYEEIIKKEGLALVYGKCKYINTITKRETELGIYFEQRLLDKGNIIPNNGVLHSKEISYLYGTYDSRKELRRLCDWDLWRRWSKYLQFIFVDKLIGNIEVNSIGSLSTVYKFNRELVDNLQKQDRCKELSLDNILDYEI